MIKDAGDDPDVTDGAHLTARVSWREVQGLELDRGDGVGLVTKPGLGLPVGGPAINAVPRRMISYSVEEILDPNERGVRVVISVPGGEKMAEKTTNARLGIVGGISILGTTGIVRPFSTAAWAASVVQAIDVMGAQGHKTFVLSTGGLTEKAAMRLLPDLEEVNFVEVGDFTGQALKKAVENRLEHCFFVGMVGKISKLAAGVMMTHWTRSKVDNDLLAQITLEAGGSTDLVEEVKAPTRPATHTSSGDRRTSKGRLTSSVNRLPRILPSTLKVNWRFTSSSSTSTPLIPRGPVPAPWP